MYTYVASNTTGGSKATMAHQLAVATVSRLKSRTAKTTVILVSTFTAVIKLVDVRMNQICPSVYVKHGSRARRGGERAIRGHHTEVRKIEAQHRIHLRSQQNGDRRRADCCELWEEHTTIVSAQINSGRGHLAVGGANIGHEAGQNSILICNNAATHECGSQREEG